MKTNYLLLKRLFHKLSIGVAIALFVTGQVYADSRGIWISAEELQRRPMSGSEWNNLIRKAEGSLGTANVGDQDSKHDTATLATALAAVRTGRTDLRQKATNALLSAIGTEEEGRGRWLSVGRNLGAYVIAADLLDLHADGDPSSPGSRIEVWLARFFTRTLKHNNNDNQIHFRDSAWASGSNASAQEGFSYAALAAYLNRRDELDWSWTAFRRYAGDRTSLHTMSANDTSWQYIPSDPVGIQDPGSTKNGCRLDGAIGNDMSRGGSYSCTPEYTQYPWVGLEGAVPAALILQRAGYPAFDVVAKALKRATDYLFHVRTVTGNSNWFDGDRAREIVYLINLAYDANFPFIGPAGEGRTVGWTDWTHDSKSVRAGSQSSYKNLVPPPTNLRIINPANNYNQ